MPSYRIGFGSDFVLEDRKVGLGNEDPTETLHTTGAVSAGDLSISVITTLSGYTVFTSK